MNIGASTTGENVNINLGRLVESRLLVQANSGAGKSWALRRLLEQTHGKVQHLVIDVEDEFHTLREKFDYVLAGRHGGDCPAEVRSAPLLAHRLLELGVSAIIGIYELKHHDRIQFVKLFLNALINAPRTLWHPALIVVDEAHLFCPEKEKSEAAGAVIDLMTRGRKRGFCGVLATQRIAKLDKDAAAEANNKLIGRSSLDVDMERAAKELGFSSRDDKLKLRALKPGDFFAFGPAISDVVTEIKVGPVETTHPKAGQRSAAPPPPRETVKRILGQLADLPKEAEAEAQTAADLRRTITDLRRELSRKQVPAAALVQVMDKAAIAKAVTRAVEAERRRILAGVKQASQKIAGIPAAIEAARGILDPLWMDLKPVSVETVAARPSQPFRAPTFKAEPVRQRPAGDSNGASSIGQGLNRRILTTLAQNPDGMGLDRLAILSHSTVGGHFTNTVGSLRASGLITPARVNPIKIIEAGLDALGDFEPLPEGEELRQYWIQRLGTGLGSRILQVLIDKYPDTVTLEELAGACNSAIGGHFTNTVGRLRSMGLMTPARQPIAASESLF